MYQQETWIFFSLENVLITCLKSSAGPGWLFKIESYLPLGQESSWHLQLRSLFFREVSSFAKDNFLAQANPLNSHLPSLTVLLLPKIATPRVCAGGGAGGRCAAECVHPLRVRWWRRRCTPHRWLGSQANPSDSHGTSPGAPIAAQKAYILLLWAAWVSEGLGCPVSSRLGSHQ